MGDLLKRLAAPLVVVFLILLTVVSMVGDRRARDTGGRDLPWWQASVPSGSSQQAPSRRLL